jgi:hypothetical protein
MGSIRAPRVPVTNPSPNRFPVSNPDSFLDSRSPRDSPPVRKWRPPSPERPHRATGCRLNTATSASFDERAAEHWGGNGQSRQEPVRTAHRCDGLRQRERGLPRSRSRSRLPGPWDMGTWHLRKGSPQMLLCPCGTRGTAERDPIASTPVPSRFPVVVGYSGSANALLTILGVRKIKSSLRSSRKRRRLKKTPRTGMSPRKGTWSTLRPVFRV